MLSATTTAGYYVALRLGLITLHPPVVYWIFAVLVVVAAMLIQGLGILLPTNLRVYFELRRDEPDMLKIQKLMKRYVKVVPLQAVSQFIIIFIMAELRLDSHLDYETLSSDSRKVLIQLRSCADVTDKER